MAKRIPGGLTKIMLTLAMAVGMLMLLAPIVLAADWETATSTPENSNPLYDIAYGNGKFIAVGYAASGTVDPTGTVLTSTDGSSWTPVTNVGSRVNLGCVTFANGVWIITGEKGYTYRSVDNGLNWTEVRAFADDYIGLTSICYGNGKFVMVGYDGSNPPRVLTSEDGQIWEAWSPSDLNPLYGTAYGNETYLVVGGSTKGVVLKSSDALSWTKTYEVDNKTLQCATYGKNTFVAGGYFSNGVNGRSLIIYSLDNGDTWQEASTLTYLKNGTPTNDQGCIWSIQFVDDGFYALSGDGVIYYSPDGINWTQDSEDTDYWWYGAAYGDQTACVSDANNGVINYKTIPFTYTSASLSADYKVATLTFGDSVLDNTEGQLSNYITFAADGNSFAALDASDTAAIEDGKLVITFNTPLTGSINKIQVAANALKNASGVAKTNAIITEAIDASASSAPPVYSSASISGDHKAVTLTFNKPVSDNTDGHLTDNITFSTNGTTYDALAGSGTAAIAGGRLVVTFNAALTGNTNRIQVAANALKDANNNVKTDITTTEAIDAGADVTSPIYSSAELTSLHKVVTLTFNEAVEANWNPIKNWVTFAADGINFNALNYNDTVEIKDGKLVVTFNTSLTGTTNKIQVAANVLKDVSGNVKIDVTTTEAIDASSDITPPGVTITSTAPYFTNVTPIPFTITFSESVTGFEAADISVSNGTVASLTGSDTTYTANVAPIAQDAEIVNISANVAQDEAGNGNTAAEAYTLIYDSKAPYTGNSGTITVSGVTSNSVDLAWTEGWDSDTMVNELNYKVVYSMTDNINTPADAENNGILVEDWTKNLTSTRAEGLIPATTYYFNVLVKDKAGNIACYNMQNQATAPITPAAPSNPVTDDSNNTFDWTNVDGYDNVSDYEYTKNGGTDWNPCTEKPQTGFTGDIAADQVKVRVCALGGNNAGEALTATEAFTMNQVPAGLTVETNSLPDGIVGIIYSSGALSATGGTAPYTWSASGLPDELEINTETGEITGTPNNAETYTIHLTVTDSSSSSSNASKDLDLTINVTTDPGYDKCFIATAAFGSKSVWPVTLLRQFRDQYLLSNKIGKAFVKFYYKHSPPIAKIIAEKEPLKIAVRAMLAPIIGVVYLMYHPVLGVAVLALLIILSAYMAITRRRKLRI